MTERLAALARRVESDPFFLAPALAVYARAEGLSDAELAARLGCVPDRLPAIRLCRLPRPAPARFQHDVDRIADAFQIDGAVIAEAVRLASALSTLGQFDGQDGFLMAARDRVENEGDDPDEPEER